MISKNPQDQMNVLTDSKNAISKKREALAAELENKLKDITTKSSRISELLLDGKDPKQVIDSLGADQKIASSIEDAIRLADEKIKPLENQIREVQSEALRIEFGEGMRALMPSVLALSKKMEDLVKEFAPIAKEYKRLDDIAQTKIFPRVRKESNGAYFSSSALVSLFEAHGGIEHHVKRINEIIAERMNKR